MIEFLDGPAKDVKHLLLHRAPVFLRAVQHKDGTWDALDQIEDRPSLDETPYAYRIVGEPGDFHLLCARGWNAPGWYKSAAYRLVNPQPPERLMRSNPAWQKWTSEMHAAEKKETP
jgi:hypothetical protein